MDEYLTKINDWFGTNNETREVFSDKFGTKLFLVHVPKDSTIYLSRLFFIRGEINLITDSELSYKGDGNEIMDICEKAIVTALKVIK